MSEIPLSKSSLQKSIYARQPTPFERLQANVDHIEWQQDRAIQCYREMEIWNQENEELRAYIGRLEKRILILESLCLKIDAFDSVLTSFPDTRRRYERQEETYAS